MATYNCPYCTATGFSYAGLATHINSIHPGQSVPTEGALGGGSASFSANPTSIERGHSSTLSWNTQNADTVELDGITVDARGNRTVTPTATTTYNLYVVFVDGSDKSLSVTVTVTEPTPPPPPPPTYTCTYCGAQFLTQAELDTHILSVHAVTPAPSLNFSANPTTINSGESANITWLTVEAKKAWLDNIEVELNGTRKAYPTTTTTYTLEVLFKDGSTDDKSVTVTVIVVLPPPPPPPPPDEFYASPQQIVEGQESTLHWTVYNSLTVELDGVSVSPTGSKIVAPTVSQEYELYITRSGDMESYLSTTIGVSPIEYTGIPTHWYSAEYQRDVIDLLARLPLSPEDKKRQYSTWCYVVGVALTYNDLVACGAEQATFKHVYHGGW